MNKFKFTKLAVCLIGTIIFTNDSINIESTSINSTEIAIAGMTVALENYYGAINEDATDVQGTTIESSGEPMSAIQSMNFVREEIATSIAEDYVNIRKEPNETGEVLGRLHNGKKAVVLGYEGDWVKIQTEEITGYSMASFLSIEKVAEEVQEESNEIEKIEETTGDIIEENTDSNIEETTENIDEDTTNASEETETEQIEEVGVEEPSPYEDLAISIANDYVNIRKKPNEEAKILGKLYKGSAGTVLGRKGDWVHIQSGSVEGYIMGDYLAIGKKAEKLVNKYGIKTATIIGQTVRIRKEPGLDSITLDTLALGETYDVISDKNDEWVEVHVDESLQGFVSKEFTNIEVTFDKAISIEEERAKREAEEAAKREEEEARKAEEARVAEAARKAEEARKVAEAARKAEETQKTTQATQPTQSSTTESSTNKVTSNVTSGSRNEMVAYAKRFLGNRYVYGGTSLTNGTDCSGFTMSIYSHFGYSIGRTSRDQAASSKGKTISTSSIKVGDLVFYASNGTVNHVAMYIGNGQVIHASSARTGIKISNMYYRQPYKVRTFIND